MIYLDLFSLLGVSTSCSSTFVGESQSMSCMGGGSRQPNPPAITVKQQPLRKGHVLQMQRKQHANVMEVRCIIEANLSFNLLKTPCWRNMLEAFSTIGEKHSGVT